MDPHRRINPVILLCQLDGAIEGAGARPVAVADGEHGLQPGLPRARKDLGAIAVEALVLEMAWESMNIGG